MGKRGECCVVTATDDGFIQLLANVLTRIVSEGNIGGKCMMTCFNSINAPPISDYIVRIARYVHCSNECFVLALVYIDRIMKLHKEFSVSIMNIHRLLITAVMLAAKFSDDVYYSNSFYAQVGGIKVNEINLLEIKFLMLINYKLYVNANDYENCRKGVEKANSIPHIGYYNNNIRNFNINHHHNINSGAQVVNNNGAQIINNNGAQIINNNGAQIVNNNIMKYNHNLFRQQSSTTLINNNNNNRNIIDDGSKRLYTSFEDISNYIKYPSNLYEDISLINHTYIKSSNGYIMDYINNNNNNQYFNRTLSNITVSTNHTDYEHDELCKSLRNKFDECEAFVNALESRYRDNLKRKCSHNVNNWDFQYLNLLTWNKLKRNTW